MTPSLYELAYFVHYPEGDSSIQRTPIPFSGSVEDSYHVVKEDDTLLSLAEHYYSDQFLWYIIADANPDIVFDVLTLEVNTTLLIPSRETLEIIYG